MKRFLLVLSLIFFVSQCAKKKQTLDDQLTSVADTTATRQETSPVPSPEITIEQKAASVLRTLYFEFDSHLLSEENRNLLSAIGGFMKENSAVRIQIEGHCDERGSAEYNMALGQRRADEAKTYLINFGIEPGRLTTISWGEERPFVIDIGEAAWAKNRRDEFRLANRPEQIPAY